MTVICIFDTMMNNNECLDNTKDVMVIDILNYTTIRITRHEKIEDCYLKRVLDLLANHHPRHLKIQ